MQKNVLPFCRVRLPFRADTLERLSLPVRRERVVPNLRHASSGSEVKTCKTEDDGLEGAAGADVIATPKDWIEAFFLLERFLERLGRMEGRNNAHSVRLGNLMDFR